MEVYYYYDFYRFWYILGSLYFAENTHNDALTKTSSTGPSLFKPYVVSEGALITSRWYLDAELFARTFVKALRAPHSSLHQ